MPRRPKPALADQRAEPAVKFTWVGKDQADAALASPCLGRLVAVPGESRNGRIAPHRFYDGENLAVLKLLLPELAGAVKMIYIDPPYNTGRRFVYRDDFTSNGNHSGRPHAEWLSMIYPRLVLARQMLRDDGMIFVSIDDGELAHLTLLMDEVFGEENRVGNLIWEGGRKNDSRLVSISHEYLVCYAKSRKRLADAKHRWHERKPGLDRIHAQYTQLCAQHGDDHAAISAGMRSWYRRLPEEDLAKASAHYARSDGRGLYYADNISWPGGGGPTYPVLHPVTGRPCRIPSRGWVFATPERMQQEIAAGRVEFGQDESKVPTRRRYLHETEYQALASVIYQDGRAASQRLKRMFGRKVFDHPKDERVLARLVEAATEGDDLVLDFFAGSAALGHAVLLANESDGATRRFVLVQQPEATGWSDLPTIAEVAKERLRRAMAAIESARPSSSPSPRKRLGFRAFRWVTKAPAKVRKTKRR